MTLVITFLDRPALLRWTPAVVAGGVAVLIFAGGLTTGGSFNPARQLGPLLFAERFSYLWAYLLGPLVGAVILAMLVKVVGLPQPLTCNLCNSATRDAEPTMPATQHEVADHPRQPGATAKESAPSPRQVHKGRAPS